MAKVRTLTPRVAKLDAAAARPVRTAERRMTGRRLQDRRLRLWTADPHCVECGRLVDYPNGFELDHITPLFMGGEDADDNCQVLCVEVDIVDGRVVKVGCHASKSAGEAAGLGGSRRE